MTRSYAGALAGLLVLMFCVTCPKMGTPEDSPQDSLLNPLRKYHRFRHLRPFRPELERLANRLIKEGQASEIAVYFRSLNDGVWIGINEKTRFAPASLMKVPLMMLYLKETEKNPSLMEKELTVVPSSHYLQFFPSKVRLKKDEQYKVGELLKIMIHDSNNDAMNTLFANADPDTGMKMYQQLGIAASFSDPDDYLSLKTYTGLFRVLYNATYLNEKMSEKALNYLAHTPFDGGIVAGVPKNVTVANKFGEFASKGTRLKQLHDVGIVYHPINPYLLGIMTRGKDYERLAEAIKTISAFIYNEVDQQYKRQDQQDIPYAFEQEG